MKAPLQEGLGSSEDEERAATGWLGAEERVHLVIDVEPNPQLSALFDAGESSGKGMLAGYFLHHSLPPRRLGRVGIGN